jgi:hypothetical protein
MLPKKPVDRQTLSVCRSARLGQWGRTTQYGVPFPATGAEGTFGNGDGIGIAGIFAASSSFSLSLGLGISFGGVVVGGTTTVGGTPGVAHGAAQGLGAQQSDDLPR